MTATTEDLTTVTRRHRLRHPEIDKTRLTTEAEARVARLLYPAGDREPLTTEQRLRRAARFLGLLDAWIDKANADLYEMCLSYAVNDGYLAVWKAAGLPQTAFKNKVIAAKNLQAATGESPKYVKDAHVKFPPLAELLFTARRMRPLLKRERDEAALQMWRNEGESRNKVALTAGITADYLTVIHIRLRGPLAERGGAALAQWTSEERWLSQTGDHELTRGRELARKLHGHRQQEDGEAGGVLQALEGPQDGGWRIEIRQVATAPDMSFAQCSCGLSLRDPYPIESGLTVEAAWQHAAKAHGVKLNKAGAPMKSRASHAS